MNRKWTICVCVLGTGLIIETALLLSNPLRRSEHGIQNWLLKEAPLGSSVAEVRAVIARHGWKQDYYDWQGTPSFASENQYPGVRGSHIIGAVLGHYQGVPFHWYIDAYWGFDANGKLIGLHVRKGADFL